MKHILILVLLVILIPALSSCESYGPMKVGVCHEDVCIQFEVPGSDFRAKPSGKEVAPVQPLAVEP